MYNNQTDEITAYLCNVLNIKTDSSYVILDIQEELESISDLAEFRLFIKSHISKVSHDLEYMSGFQKFLFLVEKFNNKRLALSDKEFDSISLWCNVLYKKLTWYFGELQWLNPTKEQLKAQIWKNHQYEDKDLISPKEEQVVDIIGDTFELYRLATQRKNELQDKIREVVSQLVKDKKKNTLLLSSNNTRRISQ